MEVIVKDIKRKGIHKGNEKNDYHSEKQGICKRGNDFRRVYNIL